MTILGMAGSYIPYVGPIIGFLTPIIGLMWPQNNKNLFDILKSQIQALINQALTDKTLSDLADDLAG
ncbi:insecticidal delta-endotoxin Cry8Ea1 family protein [Bacillus cereus]|uniref:insecticidal delta-endotoxin Cry8Ea1 family protein n=1 Tax=Bacillus cereus TaxID=1396 RepID=UPI003C12B713